MGIAVVCALTSVADSATPVIRLVPSLTVQTDPDGLIAHYRLANKGTDEARNLEWTVTFAGLPQLWSPPRTVLAPGNALTVSQSLQRPESAQPGEYPLTIETRYRDGGGYPFSAVMATTVTNDLPAGAAPHPVSLRIYPPEDLDGSPVLRVVAVSRHTEPLSLDVRLLLPVNLESYQPSQRLALPPGAARAVAFPIRNRGARRGSRLAATVVATYELQAMPRCLIRSTPIVIPAHQGHLARHPLFWVLTALVLLLTVALFQWPIFARHRLAKLSLPLVGIPLWIVILWWMSAYIPPSLLLSDTLTVGGDTPAHNFLASHLREHLFNDGRLITWSHAWWSGFPAFQFYFPLPYVFIAGLSRLMPFNLAFKWVSILGLMVLPGSVYLAGRVLNFKPVTRALMMLAVIPFLMTDAHVMWGVNLYSTLAGMIANSLSFALFPLAIACAWRDADEGQARLRTVLLLTGLILSHFFTSIMAATILIAMPLLAPRAGLRRAFKGLLIDGGCALLLSAWWLIPLFTKQGYSVDFGENWSVSLLTSFHPATLLLLPFAGIAIAQAWRRRNGAVGLWLWMTVVSMILFAIGSSIHPVFVNIRLWPFIYFGLLMMAAIGGSHLLAPLRAPALAVLALAILLGTWIDSRPSHARSWAEWNMEGLEAKPLAPVFRQLIDPLDGTPGRLAYDLQPVNNVFGSSRIFEVVPHLIDKPILEGGLVNSALGALFAYTVQGEISERGAGYPRRVPASDFNPASGLRHLDLFNVGHLIATWEPLQAVLDSSPDWQLSHAADRWKVFARAATARSTDEARDRRGDGMIGVLSGMPDHVIIRDRQDAAIRWMQTPSLLDRPMLWLRPAQTAPMGSQAMPLPQFRDLTAPTGEPDDPADLFAFNPEPVIIDTWSDHRIRFRTAAVGQPHLIKVSYYPNWKVRGASAVYMMSPAFMMVAPQASDVELIFGFTPADRVGHGLTVLGLALVTVWGIRTIKTARLNR